MVNCKARCAHGGCRYKAVLQHGCAGCCKACAYGCGAESCIRLRQANKEKIG